MRIILAVHCFFPDHVYGTETYTLRLAQHLVDLGHHCIVLSAVFAGEPHRVALVTHYEHEGIPVICVDRNHIPAQSLRESFDQPELEEVYAGIISRAAPDVIHINHLMNHSCALPRAASKARVPMWATLTDFHAFCFNGRLEETGGNLCLGPDATGIHCLACLGREASNYGWSHTELREMKLPSVRPFRSLRGLLLHAGIGSALKAKTMQGLKKRTSSQLDAYRLCQGLITPSAFLEKAFRRQAPDMSYHRMSFGVDVDRSPKPTRSNGRPLVVGFIGQLTIHKGPDLLIEAFRTLPQGSAALRIYGSESQDPSFAERLKASSTGLDVSFCGTFPSGDIATILAEIDVLVIPSRWHENSPLVLLNALATHTPVVVSDAEGMTEFVTQGHNGFIFRMGDSKSLASALKHFVAKPSLAAEMSINTAYPRTTRQMAEEVEALYRTTRPALANQI
jgi:glycosyltransferase involved in cell wall biosynthesis